VLLNGSPDPGFAFLALQPGSRLAFSALRQFSQSQMDADGSCRHLSHTAQGVLAVGPRAVDGDCGTLGATVVGQFFYASFSL